MRLSNQQSQSKKCDMNFVMYALQDKMMLTIFPFRQVFSGYNLLSNQIKFLFKYFTKTFKQRLVKD